MFRSLEVKVDRLVERLVRGDRLPRSLHDPIEEDIVRVAATLAAGRISEARMSPDLRRRLAESLRDPGPRGAADRRPTRRTAIGAAAGVLAGAIGASAFERLNGPPAAAPAKVVGGIAGGIMKPGGGRWIQVATLADLSEAQPVRVVAGDLVAYLFRSGEGVRGVSAVCSHLPCALNWENEGALLNCPCHNVNFTAEGRPVGAAYELPPLPSVDVRVINGVVEVHPV